MALVRLNEQHLTDIAEAIRANNGSTDTYTPGELAAAITTVSELPLKDYIQGNSSVTTYISSDIEGSIRAGGFANFTGLQTISLSTSRIGRYAFYGCSALTTLILRSKDIDSISISSNAFTNSALLKEGSHIYVYADCYDAYYSALKNETLQNALRIIEDYPEICGEVS